MCVCSDCMICSGLIHQLKCPLQEHIKFSVSTPSKNLNMCRLQVCVPIVLCHEKMCTSDYTGP